jgi:starch-binding outer membrane protein, SusD/RagB family
MHPYLSRRTRRGVATAVVATTVAAAVAVLGACSTESLLEAPDPDLIDPSNLQSAAGAEGLRVGVLSRLRAALANGTSADEGVFLQGGLLADEWKSANTFTETNEVDQRITTVENGGIENTYTRLHRTRVAAINAIEGLRKYSPDSTRNIAQMYMVKGWMELSLAENFCSGVALSTAAGAEGLEDIKYGERLTTDQLLQTTLTTLDSAITLATGTAAATVNIRQAAQLLKARALMDLNRFAEAATAASPANIPTSFVFSLTYQPTSGSNGIWSMNNNQRRLTVGDSVNTLPNATTDLNAIPFARLNDPRIPVTRSSSQSFDAQTPLNVQTIWAARDSSIRALQGIDARLIEAEVALNKGQSAAYLTILNDLRRTQQNLSLAGAPAYNLPALTDPGTPEGRVSQFFREKAIWQFSRGYRLNDLRRLVRQYGRSAESVYPSGDYYKGGKYGTAVTLVIPVEESNNEAAAAGAYGCIDLRA